MFQRRKSKGNGEESNAERLLLLLSSKEYVDTIFGSYSATNELRYQFYLLISLCFALLPLSLIIHHSSFIMHHHTIYIKNNIFFVKFKAAIVSGAAAVLFCFTFVRVRRILHVIEFCTDRLKKKPFF